LVPALARLCVRASVQLLVAVMEWPGLRGPER
jgi:hypothetical protein